MEDRIFGDDDTVRALAAVNLADPTSSAAIKALISRGFPGRLFSGETRAGSPLYSGHIGFGCKPAMAAAKRLGLSDDNIASLLKEGHVIAVTANSARFRLTVSHSLERLMPKLDALTREITALLAFAAAEAAAAIGEPAIEPKARPRLASPAKRRDEADDAARHL